MIPARNTCFPVGRHFAKVNLDLSDGLILSIACACCNVRELTGSHECSAERDHQT